MSHPLHEKIGAELRTLQNEFDVVLDTACGGTINIPLFMERTKSNDTEICNVDVLLLKDNKPRVIIEIEESSTNPTQICGKLLTSVLSKYFIHDSFSESPFILKDVLFIQIVNDSFPVNSKKKIQIKKIAERMLTIGLFGTNTGISAYKILFGTSATSDWSELVNTIKTF